MSHDVDLSHYVPLHLDEPEKFLFWDRDVAIIAFVGLIFGLLTGFRLSGLAAGVALAFYYKRLKSGRHPGSSVHLSYWYLGKPRFKALPPSYFRVLVG